jgi:predicted aspartyl protease
MTMRIPYNHALYPPAPALEIRLINPLSGQKSVLFHAVLDTGADTTVVPTKLLKQLGLHPLRKEQVRGLWGGYGVVQVFVVDFEMDGRLLDGIEVLGTPEERQILIGRNLSNQLRLYLDGPEQTVELMD